MKQSKNVSLERRIKEEFLFWDGGDLENEILKGFGQKPKKRWGYETLLFVQDKKRQKIFIEDELCLVPDTAIDETYFWSIIRSL
jgi:hypothetical protein